MHDIVHYKVHCTVHYAVRCFVRYIVHYIVNYIVRYIVQELNYAFTYCPRHAVKNKRLILRYLVPVRMVVVVVVSTKSLTRNMWPTG